MGCFSGPTIPNSGLVLQMDAANIKLYPKTGNSWRNARGTQSHTLSAGVAYSASNLGSMTFTGGSVDFVAPNLTTIATIVMWAKISASYTDKMFVGWLRYDVYCPGGSIGYNTAGGDCYGISSATATSLGVVNNWKHYVFEMRSDVSYTNNKIYVNGVQQTLSQIVGAESASNRNFNNGAGRIGGWMNDTNYRMPMDCSAFSVYNRSLSLSEIKQNFEASRSRYGL